MLRVLTCATCAVEDAPDPLCDWVIPADAVWIDLISPTREEELLVEGFVGVGVPTREDMAEIESSSRLYQEAGATVMTVSLLYRVNEEVPTLEPVTFVLAGERLVTIRYVDPKPFRLFMAKAERQHMRFAKGPTVFVNLVETIIDRVADVLEEIGAEVEAVQRKVFGEERARRLERLLERLGRAQSLNLKCRESLLSLSRMISYCALADPLEAEPEAREMLASQARDLQSLTEHSASVANNVSFLLEAALGFINLQQNQIIKVFSLFTVCLMPPTLIGAIYGMNFEHMPELAVWWAYPATLGAMLLAGLAPLIWFRVKGWL